MSHGSTKGDELRELVECVRNGGYNDCVSEFDIEDRGFDRYKNYLDIDVAVERLKLYGRQGRINVLQKVNTIREGEVASNDVIARHVNEEITALKDEQTPKGTK